MYVLECNIDDMTGEVFGYLMDRMLNAGALDVYYSPIYMKKNRPGIMVRALVRQSQIASMEEILFTESTTLGIRKYPVERSRLQRSFRKLETPYGPCSIKEAFLDGVMVKQTPEYEEIKRIAEREKLPFRVVYKEVERLAAMK